MTEKITVWVEVGGTPLLAGTLYAETARKLTSSFHYDQTYLAHPDAYELDPALPLRSGPSHADGLPGALRDTAPDRWGRRLIARQLRASGLARQLTELDYLLGVSDATRQGALRFSHAPDDSFLSDDVRVPKLLQMPRLLRAADRVVRSEDTDEDIKTLLDAGSSSLGGARPKASVVDDAGVLHIAKFSHHLDSWDVIGWEATALDLAERAGIRTPNRRLLRLRSGSALILQRFDRDGQTRCGYLSAMSLLGTSDGQDQDYLDIAEVIGSTSQAPSADLRELWTRMALSVAISNTDDHLRNHGFLRGARGWGLSPVFDINPNPESLVRHTSIGGAVEAADSANMLFDVARDFGLSAEEARDIAARVAGAVSAWPEVAESHGVPASDIADMAGALQPGLIHNQPKALPATAPAVSPRRRAKTTQASN